MMESSNLLKGREFHMKNIIDDMDLVWEETTEKHVYLNDRNEIVPEEEATKRITQLFDKDGKLLMESVAVRDDR